MKSDKKPLNEVSERVSAHYTVGISAHAASTMKSADPLIDPVARQYMPDLAELQIAPWENPDPIGDHAHSPVKGIVHRYPDRVLYKITSICPVYCRYCFRKAMVGPAKENSLKKAERKAAIDYIRNASEIWEVILTGGDPLILSAAQIAETMEELNAIEHVQIIRIHTRTPIASPEKITQAMADSLQKTNKALYIALHINHVQEITAEVRIAIKRLLDAGAVLLSQSVLLKGVNDNAETLADLYRALVALKVKPYMIHHLDYAPGTEHFRVSIEDGQQIMKQLSGHLSGLCQPTYMLDIPGGYGKVPLTPTYCTPADQSGTYTVKDFKGNIHLYPPQKEVKL